MRRTEVLQGLRRMRFEDVYGRWQQRRLSQVEAAEILGMSERTPTGARACSIDGSAKRQPDGRRSTR